MSIRLSHSVFAATLAASMLSCGVAQAQIGFPNLQQLPQIFRRPQPQPEPPPRQRQQQTPQDARQTAESGESDMPSGDGLKRYAVIVGVSSYAASDLKPLTGIDHDARQISETLIRGGFPAENVRLLVTGSETPGLIPTRRNINREIDVMLQTAGDDAVAMVMLIGHGVSVGKSGYFCPTDALAGARYDAGTARRSLLSIDELVQRMNRRRIKQKLLVVDACRDVTDGSFGGIETVDTSQHDVWLINSCSAGEFASVGYPDQSSDPHALYSYYFCEGLTGKADRYENLDGGVTIREAHKWAMRRTQRAAAREGNTQTPQIVNGAGAIPLVRVSSVLPARNRVTGDAELEHRLSAEYLAERAQPIVNTEQNRFMQEVLRQIVEDNKVDPDLFRDHHNLMCYVYGNYLTPALELDSDCSDAHLVRGYGFRSTGDYAAALAAYEAAGVPLEVYASGSLGSKDDFFTTDKNGTRVFDVEMDPEDIRRTIETLPLRATPDFRSRRIGEVRASNNLIVSDVRTVTDASGHKEQWLKITKIDDREIGTPGWIHESGVHWSESAGQLYVATSSLNSNIPALVDSQRRAAAVALEVSRLSQAQRDLDEARRIAAFVNIFTPVPAQVFLALDIASTVIGLVEQGKLQEQNRAYYDYQVAAENAPRIMEERIKLLRANQLAPIHGRPVRVSASPWSLARADLNR